jgi:hypothetical protein
LPKRKRTVAARVATRAVPQRRTLILLETGLLLGLAEGIMDELITHLALSPYLKALLLMTGVIGVFALAIRLLEPMIRGTLKMVSKLDSNGGATMRIALHAIILFLIYVGYVRVFFPSLR